MFIFDISPDRERFVEQLNTRPSETSMYELVFATANALEAVLKYAEDADERLKVLEKGRADGE